MESLFNDFLSLRIKPIFLFIFVKICLMCSTHVNLLSIIIPKNLVDFSSFILVLLINRGLFLAISTFRLVKRIKKILLCNVVFTILNGQANQRDVSYFANFINIGGTTNIIYRSVQEAAKFLSKQPNSLHIRNIVGGMAMDTCGAS